MENGPQMEVSLKPQRFIFSGIRLIVSCRWVQCTSKYLVICSDANIRQMNVPYRH